MLLSIQVRTDTPAQTLTSDLTGLKLPSLPALRTHPGVRIAFPLFWFLPLFIYLNLKCIYLAVSGLSGSMQDLHTSFGIFHAVHRFLSSCRAQV